MYKGTILNALPKVTTQLGFKSRHFDRQSQGFYPLFCKAEKCRKLTLQITVYKFSFPRAMVLKIWSLEQEDKMNTNSWSLPLTS